MFYLDLEYFFWGPVSLLMLSFFITISNVCKPKAVSQKCCANLHPPPLSVLMDVVYVNIEDCFPGVNA